MSERLRSCELTATCWYTLWYFWLGILLLTVLICSAIIFCYIYFSSKRHRRVANAPRESSPLPNAPGPPSYNEPTHSPPSYSEAMKSNRSQPLATIRQCLPGHVPSSQDVSYSSPY